MRTRSRSTLLPAMEGYISSCGDSNIYPTSTHKRINIKALRSSSMGHLDVSRGKIRVAARTPSPPSPNSPGLSRSPSQSKQRHRQQTQQNTLLGRAPARSNSSPSFSHTSAPLLSRNSSASNVQSVLPASTTKFVIPWSSTAGASPQQPQHLEHGTSSLPKPSATSTSSTATVASAVPSLPTPSRRKGLLAVTSDPQIRPTPLQRRPGRPTHTEGWNSSTRICNDQQPAFERAVPSNDEPQKPCGQARDNYGTEDSRATEVMERQVFQKESRVDYCQDKCCIHSKESIAEFIHMQRELRRCYAAMEDYESMVLKLREQSREAWAAHHQLQLEYSNRMMEGEVPAEQLLATLEAEPHDVPIRLGSKVYPLATEGEEDPSQRTDNNLKELQLIETKKALEQQVSDLQSSLLKEQDAHAATRSSLAEARDAKSRLESRVATFTRWKQRLLRVTECNTSKQDGMTKSDKSRYNVHGTTQTSTRSGADSAFVDTSPLPLPRKPPRWVVEHLQRNQEQDAVSFEVHSANQTPRLRGDENVCSSICCGEERGSTWNCSDHQLQQVCGTGSVVAGDSLGSSRLSTRFEAPLDSAADHPLPTHTGGDSAPGDAMGPLNFGNDIEHLSKRRARFLSAMKRLITNAAVLPEEPNPTLSLKTNKKTLTKFASSAVFTSPLSSGSPFYEVECSNEDGLKCRELLRALLDKEQQLAAIAAERTRYRRLYDEERRKGKATE